MHISVPKLRDALAIVEPAVARKTNGKLEVLRGVLLGDRAIQAGNLEIAIKTVLLEAEDPICFPYREVAEHLEYLGASTVEVTQSGRSVTFQTPTSKATFIGWDPADFPPFPTVEGEEVAVEGDILVRTLQELVPYVCEKDERPVLTNVALFPQTEGGPPEGVGADSFRLAVKRLPFSVPVPQDGAVKVPRAAVNALAKVWRRAPRPAVDLHAATSVGNLVTMPRPITLRVGAQGTNLLFTWGGTSLVCPHMSGSFPNYRSLIPGPGVSKVTIHTGDLTPAVKRLASIAAASSGIIRLMWKDGEALLTASAENTGEASARVRAKTEGRGFIALGSAYLLEYLKGKDCFFTAEWRNQSQAIAFSAPQHPLILIMPMFAQWGEDAKEYGYEKAPPEAEAATA